MTGRRGRRRRKLLDELTERKGYSHLKEEALDRTVWRARFGRGFGPVVRQIAELTFRHRASCILGQAFHYSPENAFYIFNQQIYFII